MATDNCHAGKWQWKAACWILIPTPVTEQQTALYTQRRGPEANDTIRGFWGHPQKTPLATDTWPRMDVWLEVNGLHLYSAFLNSGQSKHFTIWPNIHPFTHTFTHQPCKATASSSVAIRLRCLAHGHLDTQLGGAGDLTRNLQVSEPTLPPEPHATLGCTLGCRCIHRCEISCDAPHKVHT